MTKQFAAALAVSLLGLAQPGLAAVNSVAGLANPLDNTGGSARATGMGSAFVGVADDSSAILWNPAGLAGQSHLGTALHHHSWLAGIVQETAVVAVPLGAFGGVGGSLNYVNYGSIAGHDEAGAETASYTPSRFGFGAGWGTTLLAGLSAGISAKGSMQSIGSKSYSAFAADLGALWAPVPHLRVGLVYSNLGMKVSGYSLASALRVGASYGLELIPSHAMLVAVSGALEPDGVDRIQLGVEDVMFSMVAVRLGYQANLVNNHIAGLTGLTVGLGGLYKQVSLDYAFLPFGDLGTTHRVSLGYTFGGS